MSDRPARWTRLFRPGGRDDAAQQAAAASAWWSRLYHRALNGHLPWWTRFYRRARRGLVVDPVTVGAPAARPGWTAFRPYAIVLLLSALIVSRWFRTGSFIATGDMGPFIRRGWTPEMAWSWNHQTTGAGSASYTIARSFEFGLIWLCRSVGLTEYSAQWMFYTCIYSLVGFGVAFFAGAFLRHEAAIVTAGAFGVLNGFFLTRLPNPLNIISVGSVAFLTGVAMRVAQGRPVPIVLAGIALMPTSFLSFNPPMLVVAYAWAVGGTPLVALMVLGRWAAARLLWWFARAAGLAVALNAWWLLPLAQAFTGGGGATANATFTDPTNWSWSQVNNVPQNILTMVANWAWFRPQYLPFATDLDRPSWVWIRYLLPALVFLAPVVALPVRRRLAMMMLTLVLVFVVLAKGLRPPFGGFNLFLYLHAPGFWLFREPMSKLGQLLVCLFGMLLALFVEGASTRVGELWRRRFATPAQHRLGRALPLPWMPPLTRVGVFVPVVLALAYPYPLYTGSVIPDQRPTQPSAHVRVPQVWWDTAKKIDADPRPGKVLILPLDDYYQMPTTWGFFGTDTIANLLIQHPVVQTHPDGYFGDTPAFTAQVHAAETALLSGDLAPVAKLLDVVGVSKVIIRHDLIRGMPNRTFADDRLLSAAMARVPGATLLQSGTLELWQLGTGTTPTVRTYQRVLDAPGRPTASADALGTAATGTALITRPDITPVTYSPHVYDTPASTGDVVQWPVPAVDSGVPSTTVNLPTAGRFTVGQRARAAAVLAPRVVDRRLLLEDPTSVLIDGRVVSRRPPLSLPLTDPHVLAVQAGSRTVSLDHGPVTLPIGAATTLTTYRPAAVPARVSPFSEVADCNNYQPRPADQLGLVRQQARGVLRLAALDHAACSTATVLNAVPGHTYRVRLDYKRVAGARPQICVLQVGSDGCDLAPQQSMSSEWTPYENFVTLGPAAQGLQIVLHADVGLRFAARSVEEYRGLTVESLDITKPQTVWPPAVPETSVELAAGPHQISVVGGPAGTVLTGFEGLQDCFNSDSRTAEQAGLHFSEDTTETGDITYSLGAVAHLACIGSGTDDYGADSLYELSMEAESVAVRNPKFCLYLRGPNLCQTLPSVAHWDGWTTYQTLVKPDATAVDTLLYLYGLRDLEEKQRSEVQYRQVKLRPVASPETVVLVRDQPDLPASDAAWSRSNAADFPVEVTGTGPAMLALVEGAAPGWALQGKDAAKGTHLTLQGWLNGWRLTGPVTGTLAYQPAHLSRYALYLLPVTVVAAAFWTWRQARRRRRRT